MIPPAPNEVHNSWYMLSPLLTKKELKAMVCSTGEGDDDGDDDKTTVLIQILYLRMQRETSQLQILVGKGVFFLQQKIT